MFITASSAGTAVSAMSKLQKTPDGEYTASSVATNANEALDMMLTRLQDGNYAALNSPLARSSDAVRTAMFGFTLGG